MDILESFTELLAGTLILVMSIFLLTDTVLEPSIKQIEEVRQSSNDKAVTYSTPQNPEGGYQIDKNTSVFDKFTYGNKEVVDTGTSRMYFRAEQFIMLPIVDTDLNSSPQPVPLGSRRIVIVDSPYLTKEVGVQVAEIKNLTNPLYSVTYNINRTTLTEKFKVSTGKKDTLKQEVKALANTEFMSTNYGNSAPDNPITFGGFNLAIDAGINSASGRPSSSLIFTTGRVVER